jgi:acetoin:2,6-dichlorophenolindophenol oxidoreductase subunit alpha
MNGTNELKSILKKMRLIRIVEESLAIIIRNGEIYCPVHLSVGQEAISAAVCEVLEKKDYVFSTHRNHGHYLAKGGNLKNLIAEIFCRETGCSRGRGGSMHVVDKEVGFMGSSAIVGGSLPIAVGAALSSQYLKSKRISVVFFGDGATDEGIFYECINMAVLYKLPVLFVCENNDFATHLPNLIRQSNAVVSDRVKGFKINAVKVDGNNPIEIHNTARELISGIRNNTGPALLECVTYRWFSHAGCWTDMDVGFRKKVDVEYWMSKCPIKMLYKLLVSKKMISEIEFNKMNEEIENEMNDAVSYAKKSSSPQELSLHGTSMFDSF